MCLALPIILYVAYQAKWVLMSERGQVRRGGPNIIERTTLQVIYWICIVVAMAFTLFISLLFFKHMVDLFLFIWVTRPSQIVKLVSFINLNGTIFFLLLCFLVLFIVFSLQRRASFGSAETFLMSSSYMLLALPIKLILDPPYRAIHYFTLSCCRKYFSLAFYATLYSTLAVMYGVFIWNVASMDSNIPVIVPIYLLFYILAFVAYLLGTAFNFIVKYTEGIIFSVREMSNPDEEILASKNNNVRRKRIYYTVEYYQ